MDFLYLSEVICFKLLTLTWNDL